MYPRPSLIKYVEEEKMKRKMKPSQLQMAENDVNIKELPPNHVINPLIPITVEKYPSSNLLIM